MIFSDEQNLEITFLRLTWKHLVYCKETLFFFHLYKQKLALIPECLRPNKHFHDTIAFLAAVEHGVREISNTLPWESYDFSANITPHFSGHTLIMIDVINYKAWYTWKMIHILNQKILLLYPSNLKIFSAQNIIFS